MTQVFITLDELKSKDYKWIDARYSLQDEEYGRKKYEENHVAGAVHWDLGKDLSDKNESGGRHPLPSKEKLTDLFRRSGLQLEDHIVIYDDGGSPFATRAWWILHYAGFKHAYVLLEGFSSIEQSQIATTKDLPNIDETDVQPNWRDEILVKREDVEKIVAGKIQSTLIDARAYERYIGKQEPLDRIAGHIPTARNFDWEQLKENGVYAQTDAVKEELETFAKNEKELTVYCGSGVTATPIFAMLSHLGYGNVRLYAGSYSDWVSKSDAVVEKGEQTPRKK